MVNGPGDEEGADCEERAELLRGPRVARMAPKKKLWVHYQLCGCIIQDCGCICTQKEI